ncbi:type VI secretion system Vgr family protein [Dentiradicibacter hellwigii]|uniref:Type VI secretion system tip protein TssI/VgrG n=1 Tax=Dentiradicibacter hellwigii TaxID=3149053 RepID=A0ABV4UF19_9RHOO
MNRLLTSHLGGEGKLKAVWLEGTEALSTLYRIRVRLISEDGQIDCQKLLGEAGSVELLAAGGAKRYFSGQIVRMGALGKAGRYYRYEAHLSPKLWHAGRTSDFRIWQNLTVKEIAEELLGKHAIRHDWRTKNALKRWEYKVQYGETDLEFLERLLAHEGLYYWFEHKKGGERLIIADHFTTPDTYPGYENVLYCPPDEAREDEDHYWDWNLSRRPEPGRYTQGDYDFKKPAKDLTTGHSDPRGHLFDQYERYAYPGNYTDPGEGEQYAIARLEALQAGQDLITLTGKVRGALPGYRFTLRNHPREEQNRELLVVRADYRATDNDYEAWGEREEAGYQVIVKAQPADKGYRPLARSGPRARGPETAVVVGPAGEEIHTDEYGRVKVHFHWDRYGKKDGSDSCWIRVASPWAGSNFGGIHIPRIGQEVIVDYEYGDPDRPLITGRVYNAAQMPPWELPANKTQSGFLTRSSKGGAPGEGLRDGAGAANALRFEDKAGAEQLWLHAQQDQLTEVERDEDKWVGQDRRKEIDRDEFNTIHRDRTEVVDRNEKINVHGWRTEEVDLDETITIHQNRKERVDHNETISIGDNRNESVGKNETITIGINRTESVGKNEKVKIGVLKSEAVGLVSFSTTGLAHTETVGVVHTSTAGIQRFENTGRDKTETVGHDRKENISHDNTLNIGNNSTTEIGKNRTTTVVGNDGLEVGESLGIKAKKIELIGTEEVSISCGNSTIRLTPQLIEILSSLVKINC